MKSPWPHTVTVLLALVLVAGACGGGDDDVSPGAEPEETAASTSTPAAPAPTVPTSTSAAPAITSTTASTTPPEQQGPLVFDFALVRGEENPVIPDGEAGEWDSRWTFAPNVVFHEGTFHMFFTGWGADGLGIGYATSVDGIEFEKQGQGPIVELLPGDTSVEAGRAVARVRDDGTWEMFVGEWVDLKTQGNGIWRATAPAAAGPWTVDAEPLFVSPADSWAPRIEPQSILPGTDTVYYDGVRNNTLQVGALVGDGSGNWVPHDDPATTDTQLEVHDPVFVPAVDDEEAWDHAAVASPLIFATADGYEMFYAGWFEDRTKSKEQWDWLGYATSSDGLVWDRYEFNPVVELTNENGWLWMSSVAVDDVYFIYFAIQAGKHGIGVIQGTVSER